VPCVATVVLGTTALGSTAAPGAGGQLSSLVAAERSAELELFAAESALARARSASARLERRRQALETALRRAQANAALTRRALTATNVRVATLLRRLYVEGDPEPIAVLLGARSLDGMLTGIDELERATLRNRRLAADVRVQAGRLRLRVARLTRARRALAVAERRAEAAVAADVAALAARRATIERIRRSAHLTRARLAAVEARAKAAQLASERLAAGPSVAGPAPTADAGPPPGGEPPPQAASGTRILVVDAVAYHLPGRTASGLSVGVGVIAVDPAVIPLGTRVFVPGYGPAVAADVGSAIKGAVIDLWMPSTAAARAWGRRTVTITVYG
jgi:3D (Asp-Asp-Asp) domain-containing protein